MLHWAIIITSDEFGEYCLSFPNDIDNDDELYVEYNGKPVSFIWDTFAFRGGGDLDDIFDECSTCVTPLYINDSNCAVALNIKTSLWGSLNTCVFILLNIQVIFLTSLKYIFWSFSINHWLLMDTFTILLFQIPQII